MPGMLPSSASSRKQMRQRLKSRMKPRGRPHLKQRRTTRDLNFGGRLALMIIDFFAMCECQKGVAGAPAPDLAAAVMDVPCVTLVLRYLGFLFSTRRSAKNKAPCEASEIYANWPQKSTGACSTPPAVKEFLRISRHLAINPEPPAPQEAHFFYLKRRTT